SGRTLTFMGAGNFIISGVISNAGGYAVSLVKSNSGVLTLNGANTYTGATTITAGTLAGVGTIAGAVTIAPGAILAPGDDAIGTLTINNALTNNGTCLMRLNRSAGVLTNDNIKGVSTLVFGGALQLQLSGDPITVSNSFKLFSATTYRGAVTSISPTVPGTNLLWDTSSLAANGTLSVSLGSVKPQLGGCLVAGSDLLLSGGGGAAGYGVSVLSSTNLTLPLTNWSLAATGVCDGNGSFIVTNGLSSIGGGRFFVIRIP
ncbi:MAG TPA: autotransporter-associated beta strand repeat-containing protein, partial [Verrucomicrobiae bacterium]